VDTTGRDSETACAQMTKIKTGQTWTIPKHVVVYNLLLRSALEAHVDLLLARARYGRKLSALGYCAYVDAEKIKAIESDQSLPVAVRKRLVREYEASIGAALRLEAKHGTARLKELQKAGQIAGVADALLKPRPRQVNQINVFSAYRTVLRREGRAPTFPEWVEQDLTERPPTFSHLIEKDQKERKRRINGHRIKRDQVIREMARRFKLPTTPAR